MPQAARLNRSAEAIIKRLVVKSRVGAAGVGRRRKTVRSLLLGDDKRRISGRVEVDDAVVIPIVVPVTNEGYGVAIASVGNVAAAGLAVISRPQTAERIIFINGYHPIRRRDFFSSPGCVWKPSTATPLKP